MLRRTSQGSLLALVLAQAALPATRIDFARQVQPILHGKCAGCHSGDRAQAGLSLYTRADLLKGGRSGPAIVPGSSEKSLLIQRVSGAGTPRMPFNGDPLSPEEINTLKSWIDEGAEWDGPDAPSQNALPLALRRPAVPRSEFSNAIDAFQDAYFRGRNISAPAPVSDGVFVRRAYLDIWGLLPTPEQWKEFVRDRTSGKRERLIDRLLSNPRNYSEHWISYWNDLLHNDEGVSYAGGSRKPITQWLLRALQSNMPYDRMVQSLLNPTDKDDPAGFLAGVGWGGESSASQTPPMQAAQNSAQVFLGANLKCASCHDSFVSRWKLRETYGLASFFSEEPLEIVRCDVKTGEKSTPRFLFSELAGADVAITLAERRALAAHLFTAPKNGRFARTLVNRVWKRLFGRSLVEPVDDMDAQAWDSDLLDWLAADFADHHYDLQFLLQRIMTSRAYQLPSVHQSAEGDKEFVFRGPLQRRLTAEQFVDAVSSITGEWRVYDEKKGAPGMYVRDWRLQSSKLTRALGRPIRDQVWTDRSSDATTLQFLELVNGETLATMFHRGAKLMLNQLKPPAANLFDSGIVTNAKVTVDVDIAGAKRLWLLLEDEGTRDRSQVVAGWSQAEFSGPDGVTRLADLKTPAGARIGPMRIKGQEPQQTVIAPLPSELIYDIAGKGYTRFRAVAGVDEASLRYQIAAKVRFFVFSEEPDREQLVRVTGDVPVSVTRDRGSADALIESVYRHALARDPSRAESKVAGEFLERRGADGLEDLLWAICLSPEFQLIR